MLNNNLFITSSNYSLMENLRGWPEFTDLHFGDTLGHFQQHAQVPVVKYFNEKPFGIYIYLFFLGICNISTEIIVFLYNE